MQLTTKFCFFSILLLCAFSRPALADLAPRTAEYQLINLINSQRRELKLPPLQFDNTASQVARQHSDEMRQRAFFDLDSPQRGSLEYQLAYARISGRSQHSFIAIDYTIPNIFNKLKHNPAFVSEEVTHAAIGVATGYHPKYGKAVWATLILLQYMGELHNVPRTAQPGQTLSVKARLYPGFQNPRLPITMPNGRVQTYYPSSQQGNQFYFKVPLNQGKGRYTLELLLDKPGLGPRVASILPLYVGATYPQRETEPTQVRSSHFANTDQAAQHLVEKVNSERKRYGLKPLENEPLLRYVAYHHSQDMARRKFFAHINPDGEDPNERFHRQGGRGQIGENIAYDVGIDAAHARLMNSPGHRANVLHEDFTHLGVGVYFDGSHYYITQLFQRKIRAVNLSIFRQQLIQWLNAERRSGGVPPLKEETLFSETAWQHSQAMAQSDALSYLTGGLDFAERYVRRGGHYQEMNTLILTATSITEAQQKLGKHRKVLLQSKWRKLGLGALLNHSAQLGDNTVWLTIGLASP